MTSKEYIESGLLELYALGELSEQERAEVERMCSLYPEVKAELAAVEVAIEQLDTGLGVAPPSEIKTKLFGQLPAGTSTGQQRRILPSFSWAMAASVSIAVVSVAFALFYLQRYNDAAARYEALVVQQAMTAQELNQVKNSLERNQELLSVTTDESTRRISLLATSAGSDLQVFVYWNAASQEVYLDPGNLTAPASGQDYQLWAIVDGKPVDMGVLDLSDAAGLLKMKSVGQAAAFAITLEPKGGRPTPTLENMLVMGQVNV